MGKDRQHFDRVKAVRQQSGDMMGPHRKAGPHVDKREKRQGRKSTNDWLFEAEGDVLTFWRVDCNYLDPDRKLLSLGSILVEAASESDAVDKAMERVWDPRLETSGCQPHFQAWLEGED